MINSLDDIPLAELESIKAGKFDDVSLEALEFWKTISGPINETKVSETATPKIGETIKETKEGGKFYKLGDGLVGYSSPDYSTTNQADVKRMLSQIADEDFVQPSEQAMSRQRQDFISQSPAFARGVKATEGTFGIGSYVDEAAQAISPDFGSKVRAASNAMDIENPIESIALETIGAVVTSLPIGVAATLTKWGPTAAVQGITRGQKIIRGLFGGIAAGGVEGGVYGFGEGQGSFANRASSARSGAMFGAAPAGALGAVMPVFGDVVKRV